MQFNLNANYDEPAPDPRFQVPVPFYHGQTVGLGDAIRQVTQAVGLEPCTPCEERQRALNQMMQFRGWRT